MKLAARVLIVAVLLTLAGCSKPIREATGSDRALSVARAE